MRYQFFETLESRRLRSATLDGLDVHTSFGADTPPVFADLSAARSRALSAAAVQTVVTQRLTVREWGTTTGLYNVKITGYWQNGKATGPLQTMYTDRYGRVNMVGPKAAHWVLTLSKPGYLTRTATVSAVGNSSGSIPVHKA